MPNPQQVQILAALTKERSGEIREALKRMKVDIDVNDNVDLDAVDVQKLKAEIAKEAPPVKYVAPDEPTSKSKKEE